MLKSVAVSAAMLVALCLSPSSAQTFEKKNYTYSEFTQNSFSEVVTVTGPAKLIFLAGIGPEDPKDGNPRHLGSLYAQCKYSWEKIKDLLGKHGATIDDIVKSTVYVTDIRFREDMRKCRAEVFPAGQQMPAQTLLTVVALARPGMLIEVDIVAAVPK
jgi:2-iminobutanoate/2-iminopropanoate deaminase